ncbi:chaperone TorD involved in molybdoenzyme TorA maturation [Ectothiorhodospira magna]|uniref:Chaperone TorD involved in molybdoenzyme TorA maturation n=1 Tax=Ectothiorhodospira magna TaxID=867345 RepID=A0A1H9AJB1_9GAMM|nr:molecular chaperone TorD family protein [Ectothiorhodospira magna]SEP76587.1 chaperone TorD involved in molybdoenzyme TorA maturation [Ectothiorhodospira magna]
MQNPLPGDQLDVDELCILSGLLSPPTQDTLEAMEEMAESWAWLKPALPELLAVGLPLLREEYQRLFVTGACPARESAWSEPILAGSAHNLMALYRQAGIALQGRAPDSLAMELIYAAWYLEQDLPNSPYGWQALWEHLCGWVPCFARCLQERANMDIYRVLGRRLETLFAPCRSDP